MALVTTAVTGNTSPEAKTGIPYSVGNLEVDFGESADPTTSTYTALCTVAWEYADEFIEEMLGRVELTVEGGKLNRVLPEYCPHKPRAYALKADLVKTLTWQGNDAATGWPTFAQSVYRVTYAVPMYDVKENEDVDYEHQRFCVWTKRITAQNEKVPGLSYKFVGTGLPLNEVGVRMGRQLEMSCKWLDVPTFDYAVISQYANRVNDLEIELDGTTWPAETVLFVGGSEDPKVNAAGQRNRDITLTFLCRIDGRTWNKFWDRGAAGADKYVLVTDDGGAGGNRIFPTADLNQIWTLS